MCINIHTYNYKTNHKKNNNTHRWAALDPSQGYRHSTAFHLEKVPPHILATRLPYGMPVLFFSGVVSSSFGRMYAAIMRSKTPP